MGLYVTHPNVQHLTSIDQLDAQALVQPRPWEIRLFLPALFKDLNETPFSSYKQILLVAFVAASPTPDHPVKGSTKR